MNLRASSASDFIRSTSGSLSAAMSAARCASPRARTRPSASRRVAFAAAAAASEAASFSSRLRISLCRFSADVRSCRAMASASSTSQGSAPSASNCAASSSRPFALSSSAAALLRSPSSLSLSSLAIISARSTSLRAPSTPSRAAFSSRSSLCTSPRLSTASLAFSTCSLNLRTALAALSAASMFPAAFPLNFSAFLSLSSLLSSPGSAPSGMPPRALAAKPAPRTVCDARRRLWRGLEPPSLSACPEVDAPAPASWARRACSCARKPDFAPALPRPSLPLASRRDFFFLPPLSKSANHTLSLRLSCMLANLSSTMDTSSAYLPRNLPRRCWISGSTAVASLTRPMWYVLSALRASMRGSSCEN
mmetsp:Transcript_49238/g.157685  ORF Transcript_49238/g.157685 Transcript_49238/m.157685 type:complete len:364 (+) Transcript_49238:549-1640(+)